MRCALFSIAVEIAGQQHWPGFGGFHKENLMSRRVTGSWLNDYGSVAKHIVVQCGGQNPGSGNALEGQIADVTDDFAFEVGPDLLPRKLMTSLAPKHNVL